ncbi:MAG: hypothetical protein M1825_005101 [Sarcosagium campestre]|nr:MAG: hypothetical protein M1825_005101 [Sarcosagium campestre]
MVSFDRRIENPAPVDYITPAFPSLYWPFREKARDAAYLYYSTDVWRFTILWTLIVYAAVFVTASLYAVVMQMRNWKFVWMIPLAYAVVGGIEAVLAGSVVGLVWVLSFIFIGAVYSAGFFKMSTWIPFVWSLINVLVLILSSFSIQGGL